MPSPLHDLAVPHLNGHRQVLAQVRLLMPAGVVQRVRQLDAVNR
jgi:hypothetical protein